MLCNKEKMSKLHVNGNFELNREIMLRLYPLSPQQPIKVQLLAERFRGLLTDPWISWYFELITCISAVLHVYLKICHGTPM